MSFEWIVALRFLREGRMQTLLIVAGVTIGVAVIIALSSLIAALQASLVARTLGTQAHITIRPAEEEAQPVLDRSATAVAARVEKRAQRLRSIDQWEAILVAAERAPGVVAASPMVAGDAFATRGNAAESVALQGVEAERYRRIVDIDSRLVAGQFRLSGTDAVIGIELAGRLGLGVGDKLRLSTARGRDDVVTVVGVFDVGNKDLNRRWVFVPLKLAQNLQDLPGGVSTIDLTVREVFGAEAVAQALEARSGLDVESWMARNAQLLQALDNQRMTNRLIRIFVVLIVALGIASVLVVSVVQKQKEIGILRAMGTSPQRVMRIFLIQGGVVGLGGSALGAGLGAGLLWLFSRYMTNADGTPLFTFAIDVQLFAAAIALAIVTGLAAAVAPARRASKLDPVAAIRYG
jgi:lipoprotein-releasing system permease protein